MFVKMADYLNHKAYFYCVLEQNNQDEGFIKSNQMQAFLELIDTNYLIRKILDVDTCYIIADRYLIAIVFIYFQRANLSLEDYNELYFFATLHLAHDMEEESDAARMFLREVLESCPLRISSDVIAGHRDAIWMAMDMKARVSREHCDELMAIAPGHTAWTRHRRPDHSGVLRFNDLSCSKCAILIKTALDMMDIDSFRDEDSDTLTITDSEEEYMEECDITGEETMDEDVTDLDE